jgi:hypothetical protein
MLNASFHGNGQTPKTLPPERLSLPNQAKRQPPREVTTDAMLSRPSDSLTPVSAQLDPTCRNGTRLSAGPWKTRDDALIGLLGHYIDLQARGAGHPGRRARRSN